MYLRLYQVMIECIVTIDDGVTGLATVRASIKSDNEAYRLERSHQPEMAANFAGSRQSSYCRVAPFADSGAPQQGMKCGKADSPLNMRP